MSIADHLMPEFDHEMASTRSLLERLPDDRGDWKPHPKSMSLGELAVHVAGIPSYCTFTIQETELDLNPPGGPKFPKTHFSNVAALLEQFDDNVRDARALLVSASDGDLMEMWTLKNGGAVVFSLPRVAVYRSMVMNHLIHHRGQLTVYARLNDVPLPGIYGPSADTPM
jgi:uncharacterized damage-inducible protein DinB